MKHRHRVLGVLFLLAVITYVDRVCISVAGSRDAPLVPMALTSPARALSWLEIDPTRPLVGEPDAPAVVT